MTNPPLAGYTGGDNGREEEKVRSRPIAVIVLLACLALPAACGGKATPAPLPATAAAAVLPTRLTAAERAAILDAAWKTVNDNYFDPTFGGKDWRAIGDEYRQKLATVEDDDTFWRQVINPMLFELGVSHLVAMPGELAEQMDLMTFSSGSPGMDLRRLEGQAVITRVDEGSPAEKAGLRPGLVVTAVAGRTLDELTAEAFKLPPDNERNRRGDGIQGMRGLLYGEAGTEVIVDYVDAEGRPQRAAVRLAPRGSDACAQIDPLLPPACAEIEVRRLAGGTGYLRFSGFVPAALDGVLAGDRRIAGAPALIIDLRGNPGGALPVRKAIAGKLVGRFKLFMRYQHRDWLEAVYLDPVDNPYQGKVVILVDELSASSSEEFAGSLQAMGRATIAGAQTPGRCLTMVMASLPAGALLSYPDGQSLTPNGRVLEDNGVIPDVEVALDRALLLEGRDSQLEAALAWLGQ